jgi:phosphoglycerol transferase MdoB-like AlkP superfamily enzyme
MRDVGQHLARVIATWVIAVAMLTAARVVFAAAYLPADLRTAAHAGEILRIFWLAARLDVSAVTLACLPSLLLAPFARRRPTLTRRVERGLAALILVATGLLSVTAHFFFFYYKDRFNIFFWEFFDELENARLVIASLPDEVPLGQAALYAVLLGAAAVAGRILLSRRLAAPLTRTVERTPAAFAIVATVVAFLLARGTLDVTPLVKQHYRQAASSIRALNWLHANPFYDLVFSWRDLHMGGWTGSVADSWPARSEVETAFARVRDRVPDWELVPRGEAQDVLEVRTKGELGRWLTKKPKHVVLILLESFTGWVQDVDGGRFGREVTPRLLELQERGLTFGNFYQAGAGTIDNICRAALQIPVPSNFSVPTDVTPAHRVFPSSLPAILRSLGYKPRFFYGGNLAWHNLGFFLAGVGFDDVFSEGDLANVEHTPFGVHDQDLYDFALAKMQASDEPTFSFIMTLSNHPPFRTPASYRDPGPIAVPAELRPILTDASYFADRYRLHRYSDYAMGRFVDMVAASPLKDDVLFVITSDHSHEGAFRFPVEDYAWSKRIPLLILAPGLLNVAPRSFATYGTHIDLGATFYDLLGAHDAELETFGRTLLAEQPRPEPMLSFFEDCQDDVCVVELAPYRRAADGKLVPCETADTACREKAKAISEFRSVVDRIGLHYLLGASTGEKARPFTRR